MDGGAVPRRQASSPTQGPRKWQPAVSRCPENGTVRSKCLANARKLLPTKAAFIMGPSGMREWGLWKPSVGSTDGSIAGDYEAAGVDAEKQNSNLVVSPGS